MESASRESPKVEELVRMAALQDIVSDLFPSAGSLEWELRKHRMDYIRGGALYEIAGRLLAHPARFRAIALELGARRLAVRHGLDGMT
jgi:hypothetical protein